MDKKTLIPVYVKSESSKFLLIGGGDTTYQIAKKLFSRHPGISVTIIDKNVPVWLIKLQDAFPGLLIYKENFESDDLKEHDFTIVIKASEDDYSELKEKAIIKGAKLCILDRPDLSDFTLSEDITQFQNSGGKQYRKLVFRIAIVFLLVFFGYLLSGIITISEASLLLKGIPSSFYIMLAVGFFAQLVDGAVGLGYGVTCSASMMLFGVNLASISGSIHTAEMFSSAVSGYSHYKFGNVNKKLFAWLAISGVLGATGGSLLLIYLGNKYENIAYSIVSAYTFIIGVRLIVIALRKNIKKKEVKSTGILGFAGGFFDAFGGGGWGPIVTSTLLSKGRRSKYVVGTVSLAEFFVTLTASLIFFSSLGVQYGYIVVGLIVGGMLAAPIAARLAGRLPQKAAIMAVAGLVMISSLRVFIKFFG